MISNSILKTTADLPNLLFLFIYLNNKKTNIKIEIYKENYKLIDQPIEYNFNDILFQDLVYMLRLIDFRIVDDFTYEQLKNIIISYLKSLSFVSFIDDNLNEIDNNIKISEIIYNIPLSPYDLNYVRKRINIDSKILLFNRKCYPCFFNYILKMIIINIEDPKIILPYLDKYNKILNFQYNLYLFAIMFIFVFIVVVILKCRL